MDQGTTEAASAVIGHPGGEDAAPLDFLQQFCGDDDFRPWLGRPFRFGDYSFATNGHIIVRIPAREGDHPPEDAPPTLEKHLAQIFVRLGSISFASPSAVVLPPPQPKCIEPCSDCDGRGKEHDCPDCECNCLSCDGSGKNEMRERISANFGGALFSLKYIRQIVALPGLEIAADSSDFATSQPLLFRFTGGDGALMPLRSKYPQHIDIEPSKGSPIT